MCRRESQGTHLCIILAARKKLPGRWAGIRESAPLLEHNVPYV